MEFTYQELARLNRMIGIALMSGKVEFDEVSESVYQKVTQEIYRRVQDEIQEENKMADTWAVTFMNDKTRKVIVDCFPASNEGEARHAFRECYRHESYTILSAVRLPD